MNQSIRWTHLSDFHFGTDQYGEGDLAESIIEHIRGRADGLPDIVFLTGDIAFSGATDQYEQFKHQFLNPLIELLGSDGNDRIFMVPGNHDLDRKIHELVARSTLQTKRPRIFDPTEEGKGQRAEVIERFTNYTYADLTSTGGEWLEGTAGVFAHKIKVKGVELGVLGINTAWLCQDSQDSEEISPGAKLVKEGLKEIAECELKVVLGHHPVDWFRSDERHSIERLFREHRVVYLHGHMHKNESKWSGWPGLGYLTVQAGAAFQARENDKWKNRILYAETDVGAGRLWVEPFTWSRKEGWVPEGGDSFPKEFYIAGRWGLPLPSTGEVLPISATPNGQVAQPIAPPIAPDGWHWLDRDYFEEQRQPPDRSSVLAYYDGRIPSWTLALASDIPRRSVVVKTVSSFIEEQEAGRSRVTLICGAGGEGKTTATMQITAALSDMGWKVLWRRSEVKGLPKNFVGALPEELGPWLIVTDDADLIAEDLYDNAMKQASGVHFLLAARDTDWSAGMEDAWRWGRLPGYRVEVLNGLTESDALQIVEAWARYGADGLGELANLPPEQAAKKLSLAAQDRDARFKHEGAFLGAMLKVRKGTELREHVASLLERLGARTIPHQTQGGDKTLRDAMAYIAAMHSENLLFLSKPVLARVLGCKPGKLKKDVLGPLGEEAAAGICGKFIFTRHRAIAEAAMELLQRRFHYDPEELYVEMSRAALEVFLERDAAYGLVPEIKKWNFISDHFFKAGQKELGILLAMNLVDVEPSNTYLLCKLAQLYRENELPGEAVNVFRNTSGVEEGQRPMLNEWATCEGCAGNYSLNVWLDGVCLSDQAERRRLDVENAPITLAGLSYACLELFTRHPNDRDYINACAAAAQLGLALNPRIETRRNLELNDEQAQSLGAPIYTVGEGLEVIKRIILLGWERREEELPSWLPSYDQLTFRELESLF
ncbi:P-loop NTPase [Pseudomonas putida]